MQVGRYDGRKSSAVRMKKVSTIPTAPLARSVRIGPGATGLLTNLFAEPIEPRRQNA